MHEVDFTVQSCAYTCNIVTWLVYDGLSVGEISFLYLILFLNISKEQLNAVDVSSKRIKTISVFLIETT